MYENGVSEEDFGVYNPRKYIVGEGFDSGWENCKNVYQNKVSCRNSEKGAYNKYMKSNRKAKEF